MAEMKICIICGKEFVPKNHKSRMCSPECRRIRSMELARDQRKQQKASKPEKAKQPRRRKQKEKTNHDKIADIAIAARKEGLTYGQYVAKYMGKM